MAATALCVIVWSGQVQIGVGFVMPLNEWHYIFKSASDEKCPLEVAWHLWTRVQAGESSLTGQACRRMCRASGNLPATPEKVAALKNCLEKYISYHPMMPPAPHPENHLASLRKHLWSFLLHKQDARTNMLTRAPGTATKDYSDYTEDVEVHAVAVMSTLVRLQPRHVGSRVPAIKWTR
ncbi:uncharacterized protein [Dermacentor albipictus]|uniref:uncharacterized protein n=1 Tax=Dermacentor albipictus TaxID=60249 RepID=UPI0038FC55C5